MDKYFTISFLNNNGKYYIKIYDVYYTENDASNDASKLINSNELDIFIGKTNRWLPIDKEDSYFNCDVSYNDKEFEKMIKYAINNVKMENLIGDEEIIQRINDSKKIINDNNKNTNDDTNTNDDSENTNDDINTNNDNENTNDDTNTNDDSENTNDNINTNDDSENTNDDTNINDDSENTNDDSENINDDNINIKKNKNESESSESEYSDSFDGDYNY